MCMFYILLIYNVYSFRVFSSSAMLFLKAIKIEYITQLARLVFGSSVLKLLAWIQFRALNAQLL